MSRRFEQTLCQRKDPNGKQIHEHMFNLLVIRRFKLKPHWYSIKHLLGWLKFLKVIIPGVDNESKQQNLPYVSVGNVK